jgi:hypothetical protein
MDTEAQQGVHKVIMRGDRVKMIQNPTGFFINGDALKTEKGALSPIFRLDQLFFPALVIKPYLFLSMH